MSAVNSTDATQRRKTSAPYVLHAVARGNVVARRFVHRATVFVDDPARRDDALIRRRAVRRDRRDQVAAEPAAILIAAFEIEIGRPMHTTLLEHRAMRDARLEPDVDDVVFFFEAPPVAR